MDLRSLQCSIFARALLWRGGTVAGDWLQEGISETRGITYPLWRERGSMVEGDFKSTAPLANRISCRLELPFNKALGTPNKTESPTTANYSQQQTNPIFISHLHSFLSCITINGGGVVAQTVPVVPHNSFWIVSAIN